MTSSVQRFPNGTIELTITIPWPDVSALYSDIIKKQKRETELPGFRKGKAPDKLVEEHIDKTKIYEEVLKELLPKVYNEAITKENLRPIITPKIELKDATENKDWIIIARTCERPTLTLGDYKKAVTDLKVKILKPGEEPKKTTLDEILAALFGVTTVTLPDLLIDHEVNRLLSELIDQTKKLGLSVDQYLTSTGRNAETIRHEYEEQAKRTLSLEFALETLADKEGILVSDDDIENVIKTGKTDEEKVALEKERYYLASVLRRQKTLDFLSAL